MAILYIFDKIRDLLSLFLLDKKQQNQFNVHEFKIPIWYFFFLNGKTGDIGIKSSAFLRTLIQK